MPDIMHDISEVTLDSENGLIFEKNVSIPIKNDDLPIRANVYRPKDDTQRYPVLVTYGPYGKDIWYGDFHEKSYSEVDPQHKSIYAAWETPEPIFWTRRGYAVVRADERGSGQSPGMLDTMSRSTSEAFVDVVEWAALQPWSSGRVGLLGVSYYAGSQWRVAARRPKGLAAIIPWEGMSDYYRDRCRQGGIFANGFIDFWWNRQVITNQYGRPGRAAAGWGEDTIEGDLSEEERSRNCRDQNVDNAANRYLDDEYYSSKAFDLEDIQVPVLSVANWGGNTLHLRGNVEGFVFADSTYKWLRFIVGRHDLPFYYSENVKLQQSFLDCFLKDDDWAGWKKGKVPKVGITLRKGNKGVNDVEAEEQWQERNEHEWPIARTRYTRYYLHADGTLSVAPPAASTVMTYQEGGDTTHPRLLQFRTSHFVQDTEFTGHITAHLNLSMNPATRDLDSEDGINGSRKSPHDIDVFVTLRHLDRNGNEVFYTGSSGNAVPLCKGWLRASLRRINTDHPKHRQYLPRREYRSSDVLAVEPSQIYPLDVEIWPTNVVVEAGGSLLFELAAGDTHGSGLFKHDHPDDRPRIVRESPNSLHINPDAENFVVLPMIPAE